MDRDFWHQRWQQRLIGFHLDDFNPHLVSFWGRLGLDSSVPVFVPLCGKSHDLLWLADQGHPVVGVELSEIAVEEFFRDHGLAFERSEIDTFSVWRGAGITLYCGDFFALRSEHLAGIGAVYDRASLIALPLPMRRRYADHLRSLLPTSAPLLLVTLDYPQQEMDGPPFAVSPDEVRALYGEWYSVTEHHSEDALDARFRERGVTRMDERVFALRAGGGQ